MNNSIRERIAVVSSFFSFLERNDVIVKNYFRGCARPPKPFETKGPEDVPDDMELKIIFNSLYEEMEATGKGSEGKKGRPGFCLELLVLLFTTG